jgi:hypothetical protein
MAIEKERFPQMAKSYNALTEQDSETTFNAACPDASHHGIAPGVFSGRVSCTYSFSSQSVFNMAIE